MRFLHTGDWHLGKRLYEVSLVEEQRDVLRQIEGIAVEERVDAVVIAGDIYDRSIPPAEAVELLDDFLTRMVRKGIAVILISGNHDSPERVGFAEGILEKQGVHIAGTYGEKLKVVTLEDGHGAVEFVCLPFVKPGVVGCGSNGEAVEQLLGRYEKQASRSVLITHYFVVGLGGEVPELSDSEVDVNVGGLDGVSAKLFRDFDYVALGHIHKPQFLGGQVYYAGSPLKYSFSEARTEKSVQLVTLEETGVTEVRKLPLKPLRDVRCIKGKLEDLIHNAEQLAVEAGCSREDYLQVTLTDTEELMDPISTLRSVYPNVLQILMEKNKVEEGASYISQLPTAHKTTGELFADFYEMLKGEPMDERRSQIAAEVASEAEAHE